MFCSVAPQYSFTDVHLHILLHRFKWVKKARLNKIDGMKNLVPLVFEICIFEIPMSSVLFMRMQ